MASVSQWPFERMQSLHFAGLTRCTASDWTKAFRRFLDEPLVPLGGPRPRPEDLEFLSSFGRQLEQGGIIEAVQPRRWSLL